MRQYSEKRNTSIHHKTGFSRFNIFSSYSGYLLFNTHACRAYYTKIKGLDSGKITSLPNLHASFQSSPKINRMLITSLICIQCKSSRFLSLVTRSRLGTPSLQFRFHTHKREKPAFLESRSAKVSSTNEKEALTSCGYT